MPSALEALAGRIAGPVLTPGAPGYESARKPAMARWHGIRPSAVVMCEDASDVAEALAFARRSGVHVAVRSGGHCFAGRSSTPGMVIDVTPMGSVSVAGGIATVGAGTRLADLYDALDESGVTIPGGCGPTVGIAGLTLGGGLGVLGRKYGLTCDRLVAARVVLADGRVIECDEERHADLFWALRGAGAGQFGVVTSLVFQTVPAPAATTFHLVWPVGDAAAAIEAWQSWAPDAPDELAASLRVADDDVLAVNLFGAMLGPESDAVELLDGFVARVGSDPASASHQHLPYRAAKQALVGLGAAEEAEPDQPRPVFSRSEFFRRPLPVDTIGALVRALGDGRGAGESRELNFTPMGGAYNRVPTDATAFAHRDERYLVEHVLVADADASTHGREWLARSWATAHPWGSGRVYPNFPDPDLADWADAYYAGNHERLVRIKRSYDPDNLFRFAEQSL